MGQTFRTWNLINSIFIMAAPLIIFQKLFTFSVIRHIRKGDKCLHAIQRYSTFGNFQDEQDDRTYVDANGQIKMKQLENDELYEGHIPTTSIQKVLLSVGSAGMSLLDPSRDDMIATLGETTGHWALKAMKQKMKDNEVGRQILQEQPVINTFTLDVDYLGDLPEGSFGKQYWKFLNKNGFSPDARLPVQFVDDPELKYVMLRYRQVHDLFHSVLGMPPHMLGEVAVKWVEALQTGLPMCVLGAFFGPLRLGPRHTQKYLNTYLPWAIRNGQNAKFLMAVYWEKHWEDDLHELRKDLNIETLPEQDSRGQYLD